MKHNHLNGPRFAKVSGALRQNILLGVETNAWTKSELGARLTMANISGAVYWHPRTTNGMFVKAGAGYSALDNGFGGGTSGFGVLGGVGYDVRVGRNLSLTPVANWFRGGFNGGSANVLQIGMGVTSH